MGHSASVEMAPQVDSRRSCTFPLCLCVCPALGRPHAWTDPFASPSAPPSTWPSAAAWASCAVDPQFCALVPCRCDRRWRRAARHRGWHPESPVWPPICYPDRLCTEKVICTETNKFCTESSAAEIPAAFQNIGRKRYGNGKLGSR